MKHTPIDILPLRRGVVMRSGKITDSYGTEYIRDEGTGQLYRVTPKAPRNPPKQLFDLDVVMNAVEKEKLENEIAETLIPEQTAEAVDYWDRPVHTILPSAEEVVAEQDRQDDESFGNGDPAAYGDSN